MSAPLKPEEVRELSRPSAWAAWRAIALDWLLIAGIFVLVIYFPRWWVYPVAMILIARQQLALALLMHDGAHGRLFKSRAWNDHVTQFFCAGPVFLPLSVYRRGHLKHHQDPLTPGDPDIILIGGYPVPKAKLAQKIIQDLVGLSYFKFLKFFMYQAKRQRRNAARGTAAGGPVAVDKMRDWFVKFSIAAPNLMILAALTWAGHPWLYLLCWTMPSMTFLQCYLRIRGLAEHAGYSPNPNQALNARTVVNPLQTFFVAPHNVNYHIEHHLYPSVPFFRLPELHRLLKKSGALPESNVFGGYGGVLAELVY